jgi:ABC-type Fe3+/spermidine/putrescine transport system ATPase subunit
MSNRVAVLSGGRLMQVDPPVTIYEKPANRFVAGFIGDANFLPATCMAVDGAGAAFGIDGADGAQVQVDDGVGGVPGGKAVLVVRPERIALVAPEQGQLRGEVRGTMYSGSDLMLHCALASPNRRPGQ